jgi:8-oxo-dGTP diphosphatase
MTPAWLLWVPLAALTVALLTLALNGNFQRLAWIGRLLKREQAPEVVIGIVVHEGKALLVERRPNAKSPLRWQFPAGQITDSYPDHAERLKSEILAETGVAVTVNGEIGRRYHRGTKKRCAYYACTYVSGEAKNGDPAENIKVAWVEVSEVPAYVSSDLYSKVRAWLKTHGR